MSAESVVLDPQVLRAIAHPVRNRILSELAAQGSMRAADLARELDVPANQASFHLRQLAKYGLIEEDPEAARDKRDRVWRTVHDGLTINLETLRAMPGGEAAATVFRHNASAWAHHVVDLAYDGSHDAAEREVRHRSVSDTALRLTRDEARALADELNEVVGRWADRGRARRDPEAETYLYLAFLQRHPEPARAEEA